MKMHGLTLTSAQLRYLRYCVRRTRSLEQREKKRACAKFGTLAESKGLIERLELSDQLVRKLKVWQDLPEGEKRDELSRV
jgi:hypothetical protein